MASLAIFFFIALIVSKTYICSRDDIMGRLDGLRRPKWVLLVQ